MDGNDLAGDDVVEHEIGEPYRVLNEISRFIGAKQPLAIWRHRVLKDEDTMVGQRGRQRMERDGPPGGDLDRRR
jgi:hypothetical protein